MADILLFLCCSQLLMPVICAPPHYTGKNPSHNLLIDEWHLMKLLLLIVKCTGLLLWVSGIIRIHPWATCALLWNFCVFHKDCCIIHPYIHICINHDQLMNRQALTLGHYMQRIWYQSLEHLCLKVAVNCSCKESWPSFCVHICVCVCVFCIFCQDSSVGIVAGLLTGWITEQSRFDSTHQWEIFLFSIASRWALRHM